MRFIAVSWPESQALMDRKGFEDSAFPISDPSGVEKFGNNAYFVEEEWYNANKSSTGKRYRHLGFYNEILDLVHLSQKSANDIVAYYKDGHGTFFKDTAQEPDSDIVPEEEMENILHGVVRFTSDGRFAVSDTTWLSWKAEHADCENEDADAFVDIYELID